MRIFPRGYKKSKFDLEQDAKAAEHTRRVRKKHREDLDEIELRAAFERYNNLKEKDNAGQTDRARRKQKTGSDHNP